MTALQGCLIHFDGEKEALTTFTEMSLSKLLDCHNLWLKLDGEQREIAKKTQDIVDKIKSSDGGTNETSNLQTLHLQYHQNCYSKFTNVELITRAQNRLNKTKGTLVATESDVEAETHVFQ